MGGFGLGRSVEIFHQVFSGTNIYVWVFPGIMVMLGIFSFLEVVTQMSFEPCTFGSGTKKILGSRRVWGSRYKHSFY